MPLGLQVYHLFRIHKRNLRAGRIKTAGHKLVALILDWDEPLWPAQKTMKRAGKLYEEICGFDNLYLAWKKARKAKPINIETLKFAYRLEENLFRLQKELTLQTYEHGGYWRFMVYDPKSREIWAAPFKDRVVHHALCNVIEPIFDRSFIPHTYACRKDKGTHKGVVRLSRFLQNPENRYCLKCDISKYFSSVNHDVLISLIERKIKDKKVLWLINKVLKSGAQTQGIPIGNLSSQLFANIYLSSLDYFVKHNLKIKYYIRYMDDFVILSKDVKSLQKNAEQIRDFLNKELRLNLHSKKAVILPIKHGINFLGFRVFTTHRRLRKSSLLRGRRRFKGLRKKYLEGTISLKKLLNHVASYLGHWKWTDSYKLRLKLLEIEEKEK